ncbi:MAG: aldo/keto reductase, partial [Myxococcota bacterium]
MKPGPFGRGASLGLGLAALGRPGYINLGHDEDLGPDKSVAALEARTWEVLDAALAAGIRYFDAARSYGQAEAFLGRWLAQRRPDDVFTSSKWGYRYTANWRI